MSQYHDYVGKLHQFMYSCHRLLKLMFLRWHSEYLDKPGHADKGLLLRGAPTREFAF